MHLKDLQSIHYIIAYHVYAESGVGSASTPEIFISLESISTNLGCNQAMEPNTNNWASNL